MANLNIYYFKFNDGKFKEVRASDDAHVLRIACETDGVFSVYNGKIKDENFVASYTNRRKDNNKKNTISDEIKKRAKILVDDNLFNPSQSDYLLIEQAMLIGASIAKE